MGKHILAVALMMLAFSANVKATTFEYIKVTMTATTQGTKYIAYNTANSTQQISHGQAGFDDLVHKLAKNDSLDTDATNWDMAILNGLGSDGWEVVFTNGTTYVLKLSKP